MTVDRYTNFILTVIALGLLLNGLNPWVAPTKSYAELSATDLYNIEGDVRSIRSDVRSIKNGYCRNSKIC